MNTVVIIMSYVVLLLVISVAFGYRWLRKLDNKIRILEISHENATRYNRQDYYSNDRRSIADRVKYLERMTDAMQQQLDTIDEEVSGHENQLQLLDAKVRKLEENGNE